jgi:hypothetical protein
VRDGGAKAHGEPVYGEAEPTCARFELVLPRTTATHTR